jgi:hypothetical protein
VEQEGIRMSDLKPCPFEDVNNCRIFQKGACMPTKDLKATILRCDYIYILFSCENCKTINEMIEDWNRRVNNG